MKAPDLNLLIYAVDRGSPMHAAAKRWWDDLLSGTETVGLAWIVLLGFARIMTNARLMGAPMTVDEACDYIDRWMAHPATTVIDPTPRHVTLVRDLLRKTGTAGNLVSDAHLAALAIEHRAELCSADRDFGRFPGLRWSDPLAGP